MIQPNPHIHHIEGGVKLWQMVTFIVCKTYLLQRIKLSLRLSFLKHLEGKTLMNYPPKLPLYGASLYNA